MDDIIQNGAGLAWSRFNRFLPTQLEASGQAQPGRADFVIDAVDRFLEQAAHRPDAPAIVMDGACVSYADLEDRARMLACLFAEHEAPSILIALPPGADAYAAMLAAGLAHGFYTPLNLNSPPAKLRRICSQLQPDIIVGTPAMLRILAGQAPGAREIDPACIHSQGRFEGSGTRNDIAYIIFTSGSTGVPKGVVVQRSGLDHYVDWIGSALGVAPTDRMSQYANIAFDLSVLEIYGALCYGASLHPAFGQGDRLMPARMARREQLTLWVSVPSVVGLMLQAGELTPDHLGSIRRFVFCGEPLLTHQVAAIFEACPDCVVQNTYGPTEATVSMTSVTMIASDYLRECGASVAIGEPITGMELLLLGGPSVDAGELVIIGPQLARGYWRDEVATERAFRTIILDGAACRAYFTGDWVERRGGRLFFRERVDFQVKVKGFRIELGDVAAAIASCGHAAVCVFKHDQVLVAVVEQADGDVDAPALRAALALTIEPHAIPQIIRSIAQLPRNDNDKIDRRLTIAWFAATAAAVA